METRRHVVWFVLLKWEFDFIEPTNIHREIPLMRGKIQEREQRGNPTFLFLLDLRAHYLSFFFSVTRIRDCCWPCQIWIKIEALNRNPAQRVIWGSRKIWMSSLNTFFCFPYNKHICFCMKSHIKTTGPFTKPVFGLVCSFVSLIPHYLHPLHEGFSFSSFQKKTIVLISYIPTRYVMQDHSNLWMGKFHLFLFLLFLQKNM